MTSRFSKTTGARLLVLAVGAVCAVVAIGPFQTLEYALVPWDKAAHFLTFYLVTSLLFIAFPRRRRLDLAFMAIFGGAGLEMLQLTSGRDAELADIAANACGVFAVVLPAYLEMARIALREESRPRKERRRSALARLKNADRRATPIVDLL